MATPMHRVKARLPPGVLAALTGIGAGLGYLLFRSEADRIADQLNESLVEGLAYVGRRLDDIEAQIGHDRPPLGFAVVSGDGMDVASVTTGGGEFPAARSGQRLLLVHEGNRSSGSEWDRALPGWHIDTLAELVADSAGGWRRAGDGDAAAVTLIAAHA